jgi:hypothetical protein
LAANSAWMAHAAHDFFRVLVKRKRVGDEWCLVMAFRPWGVAVRRAEAALRPLQKVSRDSPASPQVTGI